MAAVAGFETVLFNHRGMLDEPVLIFMPWAGGVASGTELLESLLLLDRRLYWRVDRRLGPRLGPALVAGTAGLGALRDHHRLVPGLDPVGWMGILLGVAVVAVQACGRLGAGPGSLGRPLLVAGQARRGALLVNDIPMLGLPVGLMRALPGVAVAAEAILGVSSGGVGVGRGMAGVAGSRLCLGLDFVGGPPVLGMGNSGLVTIGALL